VVFYEALIIEGAQKGLSCSIFQKGAGHEAKVEPRP